MDDKTKTMMLTLATGVIKKGLLVVGTSFAGHGIINGSQVETFVSVGMVLVGLGWSFWNDYGRAIVLSQLEVLKAKSLAQAEKLKDAGIAPVTTGQIAAQSQTLTAAEVAKTVATLPPAVQANVASTAVKALILFAVLILGALAFPGDVMAQARKLNLDPLNLVNKPVGVAATPAGPVDAAVSSFGAGIQKIEKALVDKGIADLNAAITDATNHSDNISLPCWKANLALLQSLPSQWETPPSPIGIALGIQIQRDLLNAITGNDANSLKVACAALWGDQLKIVANLGALIGVRIATGGLL